MEKLLPSLSETGIRRCNCDCGPILNFPSKTSNAFQKFGSVKKRRRRRLVNPCLAGRGEVRIQTVSAGFCSQPDQACTSWWHSSSHLLCTNLQVETIGLEKARIYIALKQRIYIYIYMCVYVCLSIYKYICICMYVCINIYIYIYMILYTYMQCIYIYI